MPRLENSFVFQRISGRSRILHLLLYELWSGNESWDGVTRADRTHEKSRRNSLPSTFLFLVFAFDTYVSSFLSFFLSFFFYPGTNQTKWVERHRRARGLPSSARLRVGGMPWMHPTLSHTVPPSPVSAVPIAGRTSFCFLEKIKIPPA